MSGYQTKYSEYEVKLRREMLESKHVRIYTPKEIQAYCKSLDLEAAPKQTLKALYDRHTDVEYRPASKRRGKQPSKQPKK